MNQDVAKIFKEWLHVYYGLSRNSAAQYVKYVNRVWNPVCNVLDGDCRIRRAVCKNKLQDYADSLQGDEHAGFISYIEFLTWIKTLPSRVKPSELLKGGLCDSYRLFQRYLLEGKREFSVTSLISFAKKYSVRTSEECAFREFTKLIDALEGKTKECVLYIRPCGRKRMEKLFKKLYKKVFRVDVKIDRRNNSYPRKVFGRIIQGNSGIAKNPIWKSAATVSSLKNFQYAHVFESRTKNPLLFSGVWNIVLLPKIVDPLSGHEAQGRWPRMFQSKFQAFIMKDYARCIQMYNDFAKRNRGKLIRVAKEIAKMNDGCSSGFVAAVEREWAPVGLMST